jgi:hypothetical protein
LDKLLGNPEVDHVKAALVHLKDQAEKQSALYRKRAAPQPAPAMESLVGAYRSDILGPAAVATDNGGLVLTLAQTGARLNLVPFDGALFTVKLVPEGPFAPAAAALGDDPMGFADFGTDAEGRLSRLRWTSDGQTFLWTKG